MKNHLILNKLYKFIYLLANYLILAILFVQCNGSVDNLITPDQPANQQHTHLPLPEDSSSNSIEAMIQLAQAEGFWFLAKTIDKLKEDRNEVNVDYPHVEDNSLTALHYAAQLGNKDIVEFLLAHQAEVNSIDMQSRSPLHLAIKNGHEEIIHILLNHGADIRIQASEDKTVLHEAIRQRNIKILEILLNRWYNTYSPDMCYQELLDDLLKIAVREGHIEIVQKLVETTANVTIQDAYGDTPLHAAAKQGNQAIIQLLLQAGADINTINEYGATPLSEANQNGHSEVVKKLLEAGANVQVVSRSTLIYRTTQES